MSPVLPRSDHTGAAPLPPPPPKPPPPTRSRDPSPATGAGAAVASQGRAKPVKSGTDLAHPQGPLAPVAKREDERYRQWLDHKLAGLAPYDIARIRKAIAEIREAQGCAATDAAFDEWLNQYGH